MYTIVNHVQLMDTPGDLVWAQEEGQVYYKPRAEGANCDNNGFLSI